MDWFITAAARARAGEALAQHALEVAGIVRLQQAASRGRWKSHRREIQKRSAARAAARAAAGARAGERPLAGHRRHEARARSSSSRPESGRCTSRSGTRRGRTARCRRRRSRSRRSRSAVEPGSPSNMTLSRNRSAWTGPRATRRSRGRSGQSCCWKASSLSAARPARPSRCGSTTGTVSFHHGRPRRLGWCGSKSAPGQVHARQHRAHLLAVKAGRAPVGGRRAAVDHRGRLAHTVCRMSPGVGLRVGHRDAAARQVLHQVQVERQLLEGQALEQRQHVAAALGVGEVVGVLDAAPMPRRSVRAPSCKMRPARRPAQRVTSVKTAM
jgi:hypothetical protein